MIEADQLHHIITATHALAVDGVDGLDGATLCDVAVSARRLRELADHLEVHALGALDESGYTDARYGQTTATWFAHRTGMDPNVGLGQVKVARVLRSHLHATDQAWLDGTIGREHVKVLVTAANPRIRDRIAAAEADLIDLADGRVFTHWKAAVVDLASRLDEDGPDPDRPGQHQSLLVPIRALRPAPRPVRRRERRGPRTDHRPQDRRARSAAKPKTANSPPTSPPSPEPSSAATPSTSSSATATSPPPPPTAIRAGVSLVLRKADDDPSGWPTLTGIAWPSLPDVSWSLTNPTGQHLALEHFATLLCDCTIEPVLVDADDNPLKLGRTKRRAQAKQRRAGIVRDGGLCVFPGCCRPATHFHHLHLWENGGPHRHREPRRALRRPPRRHPPHRLDHARHPRQLVLVANAVRGHVLEPTPRQATSRTRTTRTLRPHHRRRLNHRPVRSAPRHRDRPLRPPIPRPDPRSTAARGGASAAPRPRPPGKTPLEPSADTTIPSHHG